MNKRKTHTDVDPEAVAAIAESLEQNAGQKTKSFRLKSGILKKSYSELSEERRSSLKAMRIGILKRSWGTEAHLRAIHSYRREKAIGQIASLPDEKYNGILQDAAAAGISPGDKFINVVINRLNVRFVARIRSFRDVVRILSQYKSLNGKTIFKTYNKKRDVWVLYSEFPQGYQHLADVFGLDMTKFKEYVHTSPAA